MTSPPPRRRTMTRTLQGVLAPHRRAAHVSVGTVLSQLGGASFGWAMLVFALLNMIPAPYGSSLITSLPLLWITGQMALGSHHLSLPGPIARRRLPVTAVRKMLIRLRRLFRPLERILRPRAETIFLHRRQRALGSALFAVSAALFIPLPFSGIIPAFALLLSALALIERDGLLMRVALGIGAVAVAITATVAVLLIHGLQDLF